MTTARRRRGPLALLLALAVALAGCAGLPMSGPVNAGLTPGEAPPAPDIQYYPDAPMPGATPEQIVSGFVEAATSPIRSWEIARMFLADSLAKTWRPEVGVVVDVADARRYDVIEGNVALTLEPTATVDAHGSYTTATEGAVTLDFRLEQRADGEWRIAQAPDGIVLDRQSFPQVYSSHALAYFDPTWKYLVPDVRWFPSSGNTATYIAQELIDGAPSPWLAGAVASAFSQDIDLQRGGVPVDTDQVAQVALNDVAAGADPTALGRMMAQLEASLASTGVQSVRLTIGGALAQAEAVPVAPTRPDSRALVLRNGEFGFLAGGDVTPVDGLSDTIEDSAAAIQAIALSPDQQVAAVLQATGLVWRVTADGGNDIVDDDRAGLLPPLIDPFGYIWTASAQDPGRLRAWDPNLEPFAIDGAWPDASRLRALALSRDGSRLAALITSGGQHWAVVAAVRRDRSGRPTSLGEATRVTQLAQPGVSVAWIEDTRIGIVTGDDETSAVIEQQVGGPAERSAAPPRIVNIEFGTQDSSVRLLDADGLVYIRRGSSWQQTGTEVAVLATQMGTPQSSG